MFNLQQFKNNPEELKTLLTFELDAHGIHFKGNKYEISVGDEYFDCNSLEECSKEIEHGLKELKLHIFENWKLISKLSIAILNNSSENTASLNNILFLNNLQDCYILSSRFTDLNNISNSIYQVFGIDLASVHPQLVDNFNNTCLEIKILHSLILNELYRTELIKRFSSMVKTAQIAGPWSNVDLDMSERLWSGQEDEEYFGNREQAKKDQTRYNPENLKSGYYFSWLEQNDDPYKFENSDVDSPYPQSYQLNIP